MIYARIYKFTFNEFRMIKTTRRRSKLKIILILHSNIIDSSSVLRSIILLYYNIDENAASLRMGNIAPHRFSSK